jgi:hypothetical protein
MSASTGSVILNVEDATSYIASNGFYHWSQMQKETNTKFSYLKYAQPRKNNAFNPFPHMST